ncbi:MAG: hypothetical protein A3E25_23865 [Burkholderiales bacterium RIFCSPHIGHO2_12_FULL_69_20]|nr:MAG: hypothetical protein A3E25_23865 [Burkholderiales bacterium RIFCSPHIGHO2_12_FULL_69_20]
MGDGDQAAALCARLGLAGVVARPFADRTELMHCSKSDAPLAVVVGLPMHPAAGASATLQLPWDWDLPVIAVGPAGGLDGVELGRHLAASGAHHALASLAPADWAWSLAFAQAAHRREQAQRQHIAGLQAQLVEQRLVARAKGLLMAAQGMTEDEAFARLRSGAMQTRLPMADMARAVVDAALWAEAVNHAGQLRWLSQRCIAAAAQRLARIDPPAARRQQQDALKRAREILAGLHRLPLPDAARQALSDADAAWLALKSCLDQRLDLASLSSADAAAALALARAEVLAGLLQAVGSSPMLRVVNLCGRQRMRAQRLVKLGLLGRLGLPSAAAGKPDDRGDRGEAPALMADFDDTLQALAQLPLSSPEIAAAHQRAVDRWRDMALALQSDDTTALVRCGEDLVGSVDDLTRCWERSLQLLLG